MKLKTPIKHRLEMYTVTPFQFLEVEKTWPWVNSTLIAPYCCNFVPVDKCMNKTEEAI
jgi:hypothetical protein